MLGTDCNSSAEICNYKVFIIELQIKATVRGQTTITVTVPENSITSSIIMAIQLLQPWWLARASLYHRVSRLYNYVGIAQTRNIC